jgi:3-oxoacyl-[acyl-carrier protein] reductase
MKNALVTGGSRGIGRAVCVKLAELGYHVIVNYMSSEKSAAETLALISGAGSTGELLCF